ncbi:MAG: hypothetical protein ACKO96_04450, partial [Flammeovirgaceae bacterium]
EEPPQESYQTQDFETPIPPAKNVEIVSENNLNLVAGKKIFYEVYKQLPEGFSNPSVPIYKDQIPSPVAKNIHDEWKSEVESMFDLE